MTNTIRLLSKRTELEELLEEIELDSVARETQLTVYEKIITARINYNSSLEKGLEEILPLVNDLQGEAVIKAKSKMLSWLSKYGHAPAYIFVLNYDPDEAKHKKHVFGGHYERECIGKHVADSDISTELEDISQEDNAILVQEDGIIYATNVQLVNVKPPYMRKKADVDYNVFYGFAHAVHSRHYSSLGASHHLPGTIVYTLSEKGDVRRFERGKLTFSTINEENQNCLKNVDFLKNCSI